jgi:ADP-ribose pyrophosphatase
MTGKNMKHDKPTAIKNGWQQLQAEVIYKHQMFDLRHDQVTFPNGGTHYFTYVKKPPAVFILPVTKNKELVLIRQFRYVADAWLWEIPAGGSDDFAGSDYVELVKRELYEEIGGYAADIVPLGPVWGAAGVLDQILYVYLALGVTLEPHNHPEDTEVIEVKTLTIPQALHTIREGPTDALDGYIVLKYESLLLAIANDSFDLDFISQYT